MKTYAVSFTSRRQTWSTRVRPNRAAALEQAEWRTRWDGGEPNASDFEAAAVARAVTKLFGGKACWHADHGLQGFGQVVGAGGDCLTPQVRCDVVDASTIL